MTCRNQGKRQLSALAVRSQLHFASFTIFCAIAGCCPMHGSVRSNSMRQSSYPITLSDGAQTELGRTANATAAPQQGLVGFEPFQPGKIPVVFVHGLLSNPGTWTDLVGELRQRPDIAAQFQFWAFGYPSGEPFLWSAAQLREELNETIAALDPSGADSSLHRIVIVGHSMGGLLAKLQVADSGCSLWQSVSDYPPETICTDPESRQLLYSEFYFHPSAHVERVVFVAVPHRGSSLASRVVGRVGSFVVDEPDDAECWHQRVIRDNPRAFARTARMPTSLDMLRPANPVLRAIEPLPIGNRVHLHSIIGTGLPIVSNGPADGVVPVSSAWHAGVESEVQVRTTHRWIHRDPATAAEIARILRVHAAQCANR